MFTTLALVLLLDMAEAAELTLGDQCISVHVASGRSEKTIKGTDIDLNPDAIHQLVVIWTGKDGCPTGTWDVDVTLVSNDASGTDIALQPSAKRVAGGVALDTEVVRLIEVPLEVNLRRLEGITQDQGLSMYANGKVVWLRTELTNAAGEQFVRKEPYTIYVAETQRFDLSTQAVSYAYSYQFGQGWVDSLSAVSIGVHYSRLPRAQVGFGANLRLAALGTAFTGPEAAEEASAVQARVFATAGLEIRPKGVFGDNVLLVGPTLALLSGPSAAVGLDLTVVSPLITAQKK